MPKFEPKPPSERPFDPEWKSKFKKPKKTKKRYGMAEPMSRSRDTSSLTIWSDPWVTR